MTKPEQKKEKKPFSETKLGKWIHGVAPRIGKAIGQAIPDKGVIGFVRNMIAGDPDITPEQKIEFEKLAQEYELEFAKLEQVDRDSARKMQIEALHQDDAFSKRFIYYLSAFIVISATAFGVMLFYVEVPEPNKRMVEMFADVYLFAGALTVINFFFGSAFRNRSPQPQLKANDN